MKRQLGTTLISLLIGLLVAMLCIIAVLISYRTIVKTGVESRIAATHDAQLQIGLTTAQMFLQNAGFGLEGSNNLLITNIKIANKNIPAVLWRYRDGINITCQGLADTESSDGKKRIFVLLESNSPCNDTLNLDGFNWEVESILANLEDYSQDESNPKQISFEKISTTCTPFGVGILDNIYQHPLITISAQTVTQSIAGLGKIQVTVCLLNMAS